MEGLSPEAIGATGVGLGGVLVYAVLRLVFHAGKFVHSFNKVLDNVNQTLKAQREHYKKEESHQSAVDQHLARIEANTRIAQPRPASGEHTPIPVNAPQP